MADTTLDGALQVISEQHNIRPQGPYWLSTTVGAVIFVDNNGDVAARKTTDGGATWAAKVTLAFASATIGVWFDQQTPGDTGTKIHVAVSDFGGDLMTYAAFDITAGTWSTPNVINATNNGGVGAGGAFIQKTRAGTYVCGWCENGVTSGAYRSDDTVTWAACANPYESHVLDQVRGVSVDTGDTRDSGILFVDVSATEYSIKMYDDSADTWTETSVDVVGATPTTSTNWDTSTRLSDGHTILAYHEIPDNAGDDLLVKDLTLNSIAAPTSTSLTNVLTDIAESGCAGIFIDQATNALYVAYARGSAFLATVSIFYKKSTDGGTSWGSETAYSEDAEDDYRSIHGGAMLGSGGGRFQPIWFDDDDNDLFINLTNDIEIAAASTGHPTWKRWGGVQHSGLRAPAQAGMRVF